MEREDLMLVEMSEARRAAEAGLVVSKGIETIAEAGLMAARDGVDATRDVSAAIEKLAKAVEAQASRPVEAVFKVEITGDVTRDGR